MRDEWQCIHEIGLQCSRHTNGKLGILRGNLRSGIAIKANFRSRPSRPSRPSPATGSSFILKLRNRFALIAQLWDSLDADQVPLTAARSLKAAWLRLMRIDGTA